MFGLLSIKEKVLAGSTAVLLILLAGMWLYHTTTIHLLNSQLEEVQQEAGTLRVDKASLEAQKAQLTATLTAQNKAISDLLTAQEASSRQAQAAVEKAKLEAAKWKKLYDDIFNSPKPVADDCQAFSIQLDKYISVRKSESMK